MEELEPEVGDDRADGVLVGRDPLAAELELESADVLREQPPADAVARLEHHDVDALGGEPRGRGETRDARTDDDDVALLGLHAARSSHTRARGRLGWPAEMDLSLFFAGTAGSVPTARRGLPAVLLRAGGDRLLFDCGEGTQQQLLRSVGLPELDAVFITHFHLDHWLGLIGMVKSFDLRARERELVVYGPPGLRALIEAMRFVLGPHGLPAAHRGARAARGGPLRRLPRRRVPGRAPRPARTATRSWRTTARAGSTRPPRGRSA